MASKAKRTFFEALYERSDDESDGSPGFEVVTSRKARTSPTPAVLPSSKEDEALKPKPSIGSDGPAAKRSKSAMEPPSLARNHVSDSALLGGRKEVPKGGLQKATSFSTRGTKGTKPTKELSSSTARGTKKTKKIKEVPAIKRKKQIFEGFKFLLLPENTLDVPDWEWRVKIQRCEECGAKFADKWRNDFDITHVIVYKPEITYQELIKYLKIDAFPDGVAVVNYVYIHECITDQIVYTNVRQKKYRLKGDDLVVTKPAILVQAEPSTPRETSGATASTPSAVTPWTKYMNASHQERAVDISPPEPKNAPSAAVSTFTLAPKVRLDARARVLEKFPQYKKRVDPLIEAIQEARNDSDGPSHENTEDVLDEGQPEVLAGDGTNSAGSKDLPRQADTKSNAKPTWQDSFRCMKKNDGKGGQENPNAFTMQLLQRMVDYHDKNSNRSEHSFKATAYRRAISSLRSQSCLIATKEEARLLPSVGESIAQEIEEIVYTKRLRRLEALESDPLEKLRGIFTKIYGVGMKQADIWIANGYRTLNDIESKAQLTVNQRAGLEHYDDFQQRIPRDEVREHEVLMKQILSEVSPHLQCTVGGSYRRGAADSGDIDFLVTSPKLDTDVLKNLVFDELIPRLNKIGYIKQNLTLNKTRRGTKWFGAASLPGSAGPWRRIDIMVAPWQEIGAAMLHWTGNDLFNRSMRLLARKKGMTLNEHGLWRDVIRGEQQKKLTQGILVEAHDEKKIFAALGVPWRPPEERNV